MPTLTRLEDHTTAALALAEACMRTGDITGALGWLRHRDHLVAMQDAHVNDVIEQLEREVGG